MISCGKCGAKHATVNDVRACYRLEAYEKPLPAVDPQPVTPEWAKDPATEKQVALITKLLDEKDWGKDGVLTSENSETAMNVCDRKTIGKREASDLIGQLLKLDIEKKSAGQKQTWPTVPEGRYALQAEDGTVTFYKVDRPDQGRWAGYIFTKRIVGSPGDWAEFRVPLAPTMDAIEKMGAMESARLFGYKAKACGRCSSPLSTVQSRAAGYGEVCAEKVGWPYPSEKEARRILGELGEEIDGTSA